MYAVLTLAACKLTELNPMSIHPTATVSVVIPTRHRPEQMAQAVASAWKQTHAPHEVIVVVDGPEDGEVDAVKPRYPETRFLTLLDPVGGAEARNCGVRAATGEWIAFLDDDDLWLPEKLSVQLAWARTCPPGTELVLSCPVLARAPGWEEVWPRTPYRSGQPMSEYLFCRRGWRYGAALLQTSTLVASRALLLRIPFSAGLKKHQDWDWLLRVAQEPEVEVRSVGTVPLAIFHIEGDRQSVGRAPDWRFSVQWAAGNRNLFTRRAWQAFLATECAAQAATAPMRERAALLRLAARGGWMQGGNLLRMLAFLAVPQTLRRRLRGLSRQLINMRF